MKCNEKLLIFQSPRARDQFSETHTGVYLNRSAAGKLYNTSNCVVYLIDRYWGYNPVDSIEDFEEVKKDG